MILPDSDPENNGQFNDDDLICYCFRYTRKNIEEDFQENGYSKIMEKIKKEKTANGCNCREKNPKGR